jgi:hypothetical protein
MKTDNPQIEQILADMAYDALQAQHPDLFQHMIGFQLVDSDDTGTKALGMFALKLGESYGYIPAFFVNGQMKPFEILFLRDKDRFVPLTKEWIDVALRDNVASGIAEKMPTIGISNPNLEIYATPPRTGRVVTAEAKLNVEDFFNKLMKQAEATIPLPLAVSLSEGHVKKAFAKMLRDHPEYTEKLCEVYPWQELKSSIIYLDKQAAKRGEPDFKIVDKLDGQTVPSETKRLLKGKIDVRDKRPGTSKTYHTQELRNYSNPDSEGFFLIPDDFGEEKLYLVMNHSSPETSSFRGRPAGQMKPLTRSFSCEDEDYRKILVVDPKDGDWFIKDRTEIFCRQPSRYTHNHKALVDTFYESLPTAKEMEMGEKYVAMKRQGYQMSMVGPFEIEELHWKKDHMYARVRCALSHRHKKLIISPTFSNSLGTPRDDVITLSSDIKVMKVGDRNFKSCGKLCSQSPKGSEYNLLRKGIYKVSMATDGVDYSVRAKNNTWSFLNKKAAAEVLCLNLNMHGVDAIKFMDKVDLEKEAAVFVKEAVDPYYAAPLHLGPEYAPYPMAQETALPIQSAPHYNAQEQWFHDQYQPMNPNHPRDGFKVGIGPENIAEQPQGGSIQEAMQGAVTGDQLLADAGALVSLSSMSNIDTLVESYMSDLEKALDKLGRMLFLYWWKSDKFIEKYHDSDLQETEDSIRNIFRGLGDLIHKFKTKKMNISSLVESEEV